MKWIKLCLSRHQTQDGYCEKFILMRGVVPLLCVCERERGGDLLTREVLLGFRSFVYYISMFRCFVDCN